MQFLLCTKWHWSWAGDIHKCNKGIVYNAVFALHKVSLIWNRTSILLLSKSNANLKFRASTGIALSSMRLSLFHNLELLWYKVITTCRHIQQRWSSWKSTREGRMNLKLLKTLFLYIFTLSVCKICTL